MSARAVIGHVHDFFRYGDPDAIVALESYLLESDVGVHAETMLDELARMGGLLDLPPRGDAV